MKRKRDCSTDAERPKLPKEKRDRKQRTGEELKRNKSEDYLKNKAAVLVTSATSTPMAAHIGVRDIFSLKKSFASGRLLQFKAGNKSPILKRRPFVYKRGTKILSLY